MKKEIKNIRELEGDIQSITLRQKLYFFIRKAPFFRANSEKNRKCVRLGASLSSLLKEIQGQDQNNRERLEKIKQSFRKVSVGLGDNVLRKIVKKSEKRVMLQSPFKRTKREMVFKPIGHDEPMSLGRIERKESGERSEYWKIDPVEKIQKIDKKIEQYLEGTEQKLRVEQMKRIK